MAQLLFGVMFISLYPCFPVMEYNVNVVHCVSKMTALDQSVIYNSLLRALPAVSGMIIEKHLGRLRIR